MRGLELFAAASPALPFARALAAARHMRLADARQHAAAFREMCATDVLENNGTASSRSAKAGKLAETSPESAEFARRAPSDELELFSSAGEEGAWELWMNAAAVAASEDDDADEDGDGDETAGEALDWLTAARVCQAAAEGALVGAPTASHGRAILRTVVGLYKLNLVDP